MPTQPSYHLQGHLVGACNCDWGCPCSFEARPTKSSCEGNYAWHIAEGHVNGMVVDGSTFSMFTKFPGAPHEGNGTGVVYIDEQMPPERRAALEAMIREVPPFSVFYSLLTTFLGFRYAPFDLKLDGIRSRLTIPGILDLHLTPMTNPVTGEDELATLYKPTGFTSKEHELCATETYRLTAEDISYDHSGQYGEFSPFEYTSA